MGTWAHVMALYVHAVIFTCPQVSKELVRVAVTWHEMWMDGLYNASAMGMPRNLKNRDMKGNSLITTNTQNKFLILLRDTRLDIRFHPRPTTH